VKYLPPVSEPLETSSPTCTISLGMALGLQRAHVEAM
jgi:hypothetical protein